jgi:hypothetical protein
MSLGPRLHLRKNSATFTKHEWQRNLYRRRLNEFVTWCEGPWRANGAPRVYVYAEQPSCRCSSACHADEANKEGEAEQKHAQTLPAIHKRGEVLVGPSVLHKRQSPLAPKERTKERTNEGNVTGASKGNFKGNGSCFTYSLREKEIGKRNWKDILESIEVLLLALIFYSILSYSILVTIIECPWITICKNQSFWRSTNSTYCFKIQIHNKLVWLVPLAQLQTTHYTIGKLNMWTLFL